jgi:hypothetical protein
MKYFLILFLLAPMICISQNLKVDERNGFKSIKLGTLFENFEGIQIIPVGNDSQIVGIWKTSDMDLGYLFDNKINFFELTFSKDTERLIIIKAMIYIQKPYIDPTVLGTWKSINDKLIIALDQPDYSRMEGELAMEWRGNKTVMATNLKPEKLAFDEDGNTIGISSIAFVIFNLDKVVKSVNKGF